MTLLRDMKVLRSGAKTNPNMGTRQPTLFLEREASCMRDLSEAHLSMGRADRRVSYKPSSPARSCACHFNPPNTTGEERAVAWDLRSRLQRKETRLGWGGEVGSGTHREQHTTPQPPPTWGRAGRETR